MQDMLERDDQWLDNNVFQLNLQLSVTDWPIFNYVQIRRQHINTFFAKKKVLQFIDISQKVMYDKAMAERKLMSIINATVSHEMRNPINSIRIQVHEMK